jgi:hypothetical protein
MTVEEARFELSRLTVRQEQLESEILAILNKGCLPLEDAKRKIDELEASGVETETVNGVKRLVEKRTYDGQERRFTILPIWYPRYAAMNDVFESLEMDKVMVKAMKKSQVEKKRMGIENAVGDGYITAHEKVFEKLEEYLANKTKIEELDKALKIGQSPQKTGGTTVQPSYVEDLISDGYLHPDGKTPVRGLSETASVLVRIIKKPVTWEFLQSMFFKSDGTKYSKSACKQARDYANTNTTY